MQLEDILAIGDNREQWEQLCFAIGGEKRDKSTVVLVVVDSLSMRHALQQEVERYCNLYQHHILDFSNTEVVSLTATLQEWLPHTVLKSQPVQHMVHVFGLENSLTVSEEGELRPGPMLAEVNFQRELLFAMPFITVLWADRYFEHQLQTQASDLWSWLTYRYRFSMPADTEEETQPLPEPTGHIAITPEVEEKLKQFQEAYEKIRLDGPDTGRRLKAQLNVLLPWGEELTNAWQFDLAEHKLLEAVRLAGLLRDDFLCMQAHYLLGTLYYHHRKFDRSVKEYEIVLGLHNKHGWKENLGNTYHQIGLVYQEQEEWDKAIEMLVQALISYESEGQLHELGGTYHQIGRVYEEQRQWQKAIGMYDRAIKAKKYTGQLYDLGSTYDHMGMVYQNQQQWDKALQMYGEAIKAKEGTGQLHKFGNTYHRMGMVHEKQRHWDKALQMYVKALEANKDTGQLHQIGHNYHQIGRLHEQQQQWDKALEMYGEATKAYTETAQFHELGGPYHQTGCIHEEQGNLTEALQAFKQALDAHRKYALNKKDQEIIENSIVRVSKKLGQ